MDKFRAVRKLKLFISGQPEFYDLIEKLLGKVSRSLEELEVSFGSRPPPEFMEPGEDLPRLAGLRKLRIETMPISERGTSTRMFDAGSRPCYELLAFADEMDNLEEFKLDILELVDWPLRSLKELTIDMGIFSLNEADFFTVRTRIEEQNLKISEDGDAVHVNPNS